MRIFAVIDTNVLVSSLLTRNGMSPVLWIIDALREGAFSTLYNDEIIAEYRDVLTRGKFSFDAETIESIIEIVLDNGFFAERQQSSEYQRDKDDVVFYEVALSKEGAYVVTGNIKDFPANPIVVTPAEMVKILEDANLIRRLE